VLEAYKIHVRFEDNSEGVVDLSDVIQQGGVFEPLRDYSLFQQAYIDPEWSVLCWPGGIDIAPETLYESLKQTQN